MHFITFVVTDMKPTEEMLESLLEPFMREVEEGGKFDYWALGGRFSGQVIPHDLANTITGGPDVSSGELKIMNELAACWDVVLHRPGSKPGPGVDVARFDNIKSLGKIAPDAILINGEWRELRCDMLLYLEGLSRLAETSPDMREQEQAMLRDPEIQQQAEAEKVVQSRWHQDWRDLLDSVPLTSWLAVVDCHE